jgi:predicted RND superfamily exporter protein
MGAFRRLAYAAAARDAGFVSLAAVTLMVAFSFAPALSLSIGANIALLFAIFMILRAVCLRDESIERTEAWLVLQPRERPAGDIGRRLARDELQDVLLRFARAAAGAAIVLYGASLVVSLNAESRSLHAVVTQSHG